MTPPRPHHAPSLPKSGRHTLPLLLLLAVGLLMTAVALWLRTSRRSPRQFLPADPVLAAAPLATVTPSEKPQPAAVAVLQRSAEEPAPIIDAVEVEKPEVCAGEENLITVRAHTVNGTNEFLHYAVDGTLGSAVPVRLMLDSRGRVVGDHSVRVFGRQNAQLTVPLPHYRVKECQPERIVLIEPRLRANTNSEIEFLAKVLTLPPRQGERSARPAAETIAYDWQFGDGSTLHSTSPLGHHDYENRPQDRLYSYYLVSVKVTDAAGGEWTARTSVSLLNSAFEAFAQKRVVQLLVTLEPRFPKLDEDGRVAQEVRVRHARPGAVTVDNVTRVDYFDNGVGERPPRQVDPVELLGTAVIGPGKGITARVSLDTLAEPEVLSVSYFLRGTSADGYPAVGNFSIMKPPPRPTRENSTPVEDATLQAKILAARALLHQDVVTDEELWDLERRGLLPRTPDATQPHSVTMGASSSPPPAMHGPNYTATGPTVPTSIAVQTPTNDNQQAPSAGPKQLH